MGGKYQDKGGDTLTHEVHQVVKQVGERRIVVANSATSLDENNQNDIVVDGSHCGGNIADYVVDAGAKGMIGNDAGIGLESVGVGSLVHLDEKGIPAAAVAAMSAEIGVGASTYEEGVISVANEAARKLGVTVGMSAKEAAEKMFAGMA
jgi:hypothetical protein